DCVDSEGSIKEVVTETMTEPALGEYMVEVRVDYGSNTTNQVDHTTKVLAILELIKILNVDPNQLRMHVFPLSLTGATQKWWIDEVDGKITTWGELTEKFFHKYYPLSHTRKNSLISDDVDDGLDYIDFINWLNSKFRNHRRMDGITKNALWDFWTKGGDDEVLMGDIVPVTA
ncbi:hypothetical protein Tco_1341953, partial [Tanacetum coccineum]